MDRRRKDGALACVMGSMDLVRPLGLAGVRCASVAEPGSPTFHSRFVDEAIPCEDFWASAAVLVEDLVRFGASLPTPPVLFYEQDSQLVLVSRHRERLGRTFRFAVAGHDLVEDLVDKGRFQCLAERLRLPVPATRRVSPCSGDAPGGLDLRFPAVVKPLTRRGEWDELSTSKVLRVDGPEILSRLWPRLAETGLDFLVQEMVPGPEDRIESYHTYVDGNGRVAAEFTGRKIRTYPVSCGHSTALTITDEADVAALGRRLAERIGLRGVAKFDFKRDPAGGLRLLEINPRFSLWHHLGAVAGVNIPAIVHADMSGAACPRPARARTGARWVTLSKDWRAAKASGMSVRTWLPWALRCEAKSVVAWDDPMPYLGAKAPWLPRWWPQRGALAEASAAPWTATRDPANRTPHPGGDRAPLAGGDAAR